MHFCVFPQKLVQWQFREKSLVAKYPRNSSETLCMKVKKFISRKLVSQEALSRELLAKLPLNQFLKKNTKMHFEQKLKAQKYKITFKNI